MKCGIIHLKKVTTGYLMEGGADDERYHEKMEPVLEIWNQEFQKSAEKSRDLPLIQARFPACFDLAIQKALRFRPHGLFLMNHIRGHGTAKGSRCKAHRRTGLRGIAELR